MSLLRLVIDTTIPELGNLVIVGTKSHILDISFSSDKNIKSTNLPDPLPPHFKLCQTELIEYFQGKREQFTCQKYFVYLNTGNEGKTPTSFQQQVWKQLLEIPFGETKSYTELAEEINCPKGCRAVGNANGKNPYSVVVPCHRVTTKNGLGGYAGGLKVKEWLLKHEGKDLNQFTRLEYEKEKEKDKKKSIKKREKREEEEKEEEKVSVQSKKRQKIQD